MFFHSHFSLFCFVLLYNPVIIVFSVFVILFLNLQGFLFFVNVLFSLPTGLILHSFSILFSFRANYSFFYNLFCVPVHFFLNCLLCLLVLVLPGVVGSYVRSVCPSNVW